MYPLKTVPGKSAAQPWPKVPGALMMTGAKSLSPTSGMFDAKAEPLQVAAP